MLDRARKRCYIEDITASIGIRSSRKEPFDQMNILDGGTYAS